MDDRRPDIQPTTFETGFRDEELRPVAGEPTRLSHPVPPRPPINTSPMDTYPSNANAGIFRLLIGALTLGITSMGATIDAATGAVLLPTGAAWTLMAGAVLYIIASAIEGIRSRDRMGDSWRTTAAVLVKAAMGSITTILVSLGIDLETGQISISQTTETWIMITTVGYFVLSGFQAWLTSDTTGETWRTTSTGVVKALSGIVATILLANGITFVGGTPVIDSAVSTTASGVLYGVYLVLSTLQAGLTQKKVSFA